MIYNNSPSITNRYYYDSLNITYYILFLCTTIIINNYSSSNLELYF